MSERDRERPRVKVTDKRRVRAEESGPAGGRARPADGGPEQPSGPEAASVQAAGPGVSEAAAPEAAAELEQARAQAAEYLEYLQRLKAEFDNYRKRVLKEQTRAVEMAAEPLVRRLLEVLDDFELAVMSAETKPDFERFLRGVEMVYAKLHDILRAEGLERIDAEGKPFDPERHEALMQSGTGEGEPFVEDVVRQGYTLRGRVLRPAGVRVVRRPMDVVPGLGAQETAEGAAEPEQPGASGAEES